jgi:hypothetical protein
MRHLADGDVVGLAGEVPQGHFDGADAARLARVVAELLDPAEQPVDVAGVLAEEAALQHEGVVLAGAIANLAQAVDPLVGIDADQRTRHGRARHGGHAKVRDLQLGRLGIGVDVLRVSFQSLPGPQSGANASGALQKRASSVHSTVPVSSYGCSSRAT